MRKIIMFALCCWMLLGCSTKITNPAQVITIGLDDVRHKFEQKESFVLLITRSKCEYCESLLHMIELTKEEHELSIYQVIMRDDTVEHLNEDIDALETYVSRPDQTPHYYNVIEGEVVDAQMGYTMFNPDRFWEWVEKNQLE